MFVGVELDERTKSSAARVAERLRKRLDAERLRVDARWIAPETLHITLWFIGEVSDDRAEAINAALGPAFPVAPFDLALEGCGAFPPSGAPRVFWIGLRSGADPMSQLYREVAARLTPLGYEAERRPFSAHLTIARVRDASRGSTAAIRRVLGDVAASAGPSRVEAVTLFRSRLSSKGATYEPLARVPLQP